MAESTQPGQGVGAATRDVRRQCDVGAFAVGGCVGAVAMLLMWLIGYAVWSKQHKAAPRALVPVVATNAPAVEVGRWQFLVMPAGDAWVAWDTVTSKMFLRPIEGNIHDFIYIGCPATEGITYNPTNYATSKATSRDVRKAVASLKRLAAELEGDAEPEK